MHAYPYAHHHVRGGILRRITQNHSSVMGKILRRGTQNDAPINGRDFA